MHIAQTEKQIMIVNSDDEDVDEGVDILALSKTTTSTARTIEI